ncbi:MAG: FKBP-type peptidyl-prolyl cis-trans isomerase [Deltaproteobacteria bacterium]|nr:FKBP-type peptidyl-prolyl cis-trans isomerase [Deltaproteobacteria bacterium]MBW2400037.1 FKBP-type peptidyl-prolyl cis-trans isomerase [Deltaproteobacteria bacterium]MBW2666054.1 FKBP-type peptidyl-prolyl cis-trans isomerase [Deltaproteobacteria bacterium]
MTVLLLTGCVSVAERNSEESAAFLLANRQAAGVVETTAGLQYRVIRSGSGCHPTPESTVTVHYETRRVGHFAPVDSSYRRREPGVYPLPKMIGGWRQGIPEMRVGAKWEFFVPPALGYGEEGWGPVEPNEVLVFIVELLDAEPCSGVAP